MRIVRLVLRRPYTFVMALLIAILGVITIITTPTDVFQYINIPVAGVIWSYSGMTAVTMKIAFGTIAVSAPLRPLFLGTMERATVKRINLLLLAASCDRWIVPS